MGIRKEGDLKGNRCISRRKVYRGGRPELVDDLSTLANPEAVDALDKLDRLPPEKLRQKLAEFPGVKVEDGRIVEFSKSEKLSLIREVERSMLRMDLVAQLRESIEGKPPERLSPDERKTVFEIATLEKALQKKKITR